MQSFIEIMLKFTVSFDCRNENLIAMFQPGCAGLHQDNENFGIYFAQIVNFVVSD